MVLIVFIIFVSNRLLNVNINLLYWNGGKILMYIFFLIPARLERRILLYRISAVPISWSQKVTRRGIEWRTACRPLLLHYLRFPSQLCVLWSVNPPPPFLRGLLDACRKKCSNETKERNKWFFFSQSLEREFLWSWPSAHKHCCEMKKVCPLLWMHFTVWNFGVNICNIWISFISDLSVLS